MTKYYIASQTLYCKGKLVARDGDTIAVTDNIIVVNKTRGITSMLNSTTIDLWLYGDKPISKITEITKDKVNHPSHYTWLKEKCGIEVIDIIRHLDFNTGNAIKYLLRAGHKEEADYTSVQKEIEDLNKAIWYIKDRIKYLEKK